MRMLLSQLELIRPAPFDSPIRGYIPLNCPICLSRMFDPALGGDAFAVSLS
jgi:hypothetical protein